MSLSPTAPLAQPSGPSWTSGRLKSPSLVLPGLEVTRALWVFTSLKSPLASRILRILCPQRASPYRGGGGRHVADSREKELSPSFRKPAHTLHTTPTLTTASPSGGQSISHSHSVSHKTGY